MKVNEMYNDVFMRKNLNDKGDYPATGAWTQSPDIIPNGITLIPDPVTTLTNSWNSDIGKETVLYQQNYYYVRGKNLFNGPRTAKFELYFCPSNLFLFPSLWVENQMLTSSGQKQVSASVQKQGDIVVPIEPFTNRPTSDIHHCLIGRVITDGHPNPLPTQGQVTTMDDLAKFILNNPGYAWRNVVLVSRDVPTFTHYFNLSTGNEGGNVRMGINCKGITPKSRVAFSCGTPIPSGPDKGKLIELVPTEVTQSDMFLGTIDYYLPANFTTTVSYSYWANPPIQANWDLRFEAIRIYDESHELFSRALSFTELGYPKELRSSKNQIQKGIRIGQCSTKSPNK